MKPMPIDDPAEGLSDDDLLLRARAGDVAAFGEILARHAPWLTGRARQLQGAGSATKSVGDWVATVQRRALADFQRQPTEIHSLRGWLMTILRHAVIDAVRRRGGRPDEVTWTEALFADEGVGPAQEVEQREGLAQVRRHIARLGPQDQSILEWSYHAGLGDREIAQRLGMKPEAVKKRRQRALQSVRAAMAPSTAYRESEA
ncbi:MAG: sigma-70 family RNA polymerase sigma factor [Planctomycetes bacterium]|nr:sigma-70 family RNA polymerase sigma factor [Planctomycetota bacterium]